MEPIDPSKPPRVNTPALNHIGLWIDDLQVRSFSALVETKCNVVVCSYRVPLVLFSTLSYIGMLLSSSEQRPYFYSRWYSNWSVWS